MQLPFLENDARRNVVAGVRSSSTKSELFHFKHVEPIKDHHGFDEIAFQVNMSAIASAFSPF